MTATPGCLATVASTQLPRGSTQAVLPRLRDLLKFAVRTESSKRRKTRAHRTNEKKLDRHA